MNAKKILCLILSLVLIVGLFPTAALAMDPPATAVYVSSSGDDSIATGTKQSPYATIAKAADQVSENGTICLLTDITIDQSSDTDASSGFTIGKKGVTLDGGGKTVTVKFNTTKAARGANLNAEGVKLNNVTIALANGSVQGGGYKHFYAVYVGADGKDVELNQLTVKIPFDGTNPAYNRSVGHMGTGNLTIKNSSLSSKYGVELDNTGTDKKTVVISDTTAVTGWSIVSINGNYYDVTVDNCTLTSQNYWNGVDNIYAAFWFCGGVGTGDYVNGHDNTVTVTNSTLAVGASGNAAQGVTGSYLYYNEADAKQNPSYVNANRKNKCVLGDGTEVTLTGGAVLEYCNTPLAINCKSVTVPGTTIPYAASNAGNENEIPITITGGTFNADPSEYVDTESYTVVEKTDGSKTVYNVVSNELLTEAEAAADALKTALRDNGTLNITDQSTNAWGLVIHAARAYQKAVDVYGVKNKRLTEVKNTLDSVTTLNLAGEKIAENKVGGAVYYPGTDAGSLRFYPHLTKLNISNTGVTNIGALQYLEELETLNISGLTSVTNLGIMAKTGNNNETASMPNLKVLDISNTGVTDLGGLFYTKGLTSLDISGIIVGDLNFLYLNNTNYFDKLETLIAQDLTLTSIAGLVEALNKGSELNALDMTGSTLATDPDNHVGMVKDKLKGDGIGPAVLEYYIKYRYTDSQEQTITGADAVNTSKSIHLPLGVTSKITKIYGGTGTDLFKRLLGGVSQQSEVNLAAVIEVTGKKDPMVLPFGTLKLDPAFGQHELTPTGEHTLEAGFVGTAKIVAYKGEVATTEATEENTVAIVTVAQNTDAYQINAINLTTDAKGKHVGTVAYAGTTEPLVGTSVTAEIDSTNHALVITPVGEDGANYAFAENVTVTLTLADKPITLTGVTAVKFKDKADATEIPGAVLKIVVPSTATGILTLPNGTKMTGSGTDTAATIVGPISATLNANGGFAFVAEGTVTVNGDLTLGANDTFAVGKGNTNMAAVVVGHAEGDTLNVRGTGSVSFADGGKNNFYASEAYAKASPSVPMNPSDITGYFVCTNIGTTESPNFVWVKQETVTLTINPGTYTYDKDGQNVTPEGDGENLSNINSFFYNNFVKLNRSFLNKLVAPSFTITINDVKVWTQSGEESTLNYTAMAAAMAEVIKDAGTYTVKIDIDAQGSLPAASGTGTYTVTPITVTTLSLLDEDDNPVAAAYTYTGKAIKPVSKVTADDTELVKDVDYVLSYADNINAGMATVTVQGVGNYTGSVTNTFVISPMDLTNNTPTITLPETSLVYDGTEKQPTVTVGEVTLSDDPSVKEVPTFSVAYFNNVNAGGTNGAVSTASPKSGPYAAVTFTGNFSGTVYQPFVINAYDLSSTVEGAVTVTLSETQYTYDGADKTPEVTVTTPFATLVFGTDYTVAYSANKNAGENATVTVTGTGNYTGSKSETFTIAKATRAISLAPITLYMTKSESDASIEIKDNAGAGTYTFAYKDANGNAITEVISVDSDGKVTCNTPGTYSVVLTSADGTTNYAAFGTAGGTTDIRTVRVIVAENPKHEIAWDSTETSTVAFGTNNNTYATDFKATCATVAPVYTSSNTAVAEIDANGAVKIKGVGTTTLTATAPATTTNSGNAITRTLTVTPIKLTVEWSTTTSYTYNEQGQNFTATITGLNASYLPIINGVQATANTTTYTIDTKTDAGKYTAAIKLSGPNAAYYTLATGSKATQDWTISKATLTISNLKGNEVTDTDLVTDIGKMTATIGTSETGAASEPKNYTASYSSSDPTVATVNKTTGEVEIVGNGSVIFTCELTGANYVGATGSVTYARVIKDAITGVGTVTGTSAKTVVDASLNGETKTLAFNGLVGNEDTALTVDYVNDKGQTKQLTVTLTGNNISNIEAKTQVPAYGDPDTISYIGTTLTVNGVEYTVSANLAAAPTNITYSAGTIEQKAADTFTDSTLKTQLENALKTATGASSSSLIAAATDELKSVSQKAQTDGKYDGKDYAEAVGGAQTGNLDWLSNATKETVDIKAEIGMQLTPKAVVTGNGSSITSLTYDIKLQKTVYVQSKTTADRAVLEKDNFDLPEGQKIIVTVPVGNTFVPNFVIHDKGGAKTILPVTYDGDNKTATFTTDGFSDFEFISDDYTATVVYHYADGTESTKTLTRQDFNPTTSAFALPTDDAKDGWTATNGSTDNTMYKNIVAADGTEVANAIVVGKNTIKHLYAANIYSITMNSPALSGSGSGEITGNVEPGYAYAGRAITLKANAYEHYVFDSWKIEGDPNITTSNSAELTYTMPAIDNITITATPVFKKAMYTLNIADVENGSIGLKIDDTPVTTGTNVEWDTPVTVTLYPATSFVNVDGFTVTPTTGTATTGTKTFKMLTAPATVSATFVTGWNITFNQNYSGGATTVQSVKDDGTFATLPNPTRQGYTFAGWFTAPTGGTAITTATKFSADQTVYAHWTESGGSTGGGTYHSSTGSSSGSTGTGTASTVVPAATRNGSVRISDAQARPGQTVTVTVDPRNGYEVGGVKITDKNGNPIDFVDNGDGTYTFTVPNNAVLPTRVEATFVPEGTSGAISVDPGYTEPVNTQRFEDVPADAYYAPAVDWAFANAVTNGVDADHFGPTQNCTRAQFVTFLWRAAGSPEPMSTRDFTDVDAGAHSSYYRAIQWAAEQGITTGTGNGSTFSPDDTVTRGQAVTFLFRYAHAMVTGTDSGFTDVDADAYYADAVAWALSRGITNGNSATENTFGPNDFCTRAQMIAFLYRMFTGARG